MSDNVKPFEWKGKKFEGYSDIIEFALKMKDEEDRAAFVKEYCARGPYARQNIGYFSGYYDRKTAEKIMEIFETAHPIFGTTQPTGEEAFDAGVKVGQAAKRERERAKRK